MRRSRVKELHFIAPSANLASLLGSGIFSFDKSKSVGHASIAMPAVQQRRDSKALPEPDSRKLHSFANVYFDARNPMMYKRKDQRAEIIVLGISHAVLDLPGAVLTDGNAASDGTRFLASPAGLNELDENFVYARYWTDGNYWKYLERKRKKCAEVLVPDLIPANFIKTIYFPDPTARNACRSSGYQLNTEVKPDVFFA